jgi:hypothetical protein
MTQTRVLKAHIWERSDEDWYCEPSWISERLFEEEEFSGAIWDPACGLGRICESASKRNHAIVYSDICDRGYDPYGMKVVRDFLDSGDKKIENIVSNPPFDIIRDFAERALTLAIHKVAFVCPVPRLNAAGKWLKDTPLRRVWLITPRPSMSPGRVILDGAKAGGGKMDYCWLVWEHGYQGTPELRWLRKNRLNFRPYGIF